MKADKKDSSSPPLHRRRVYCVFQSERGAANWAPAIRSRALGAFTLLDLVAVVAVLGLLLAMLLPAMAKAGAGSKSFLCLNNNRQLCNAWRMYADDNRDRIVYASDDGNTFSNPLNQYAWTLWHQDFNPANRANWDPTYDIMSRPLWPYTGRNAAIYKCPSDQSYVVVGGTAKPLARSMAMNLHLGGFAGTDGGWGFSAAYRLFFKTTELNAPGPAKTFVFLDMRPDAINWGNFFTRMDGYPNNPALYRLEDLPGMLHEGAAGFSFADGHTELRRWVDPRTTPPLMQGVIPLTGIAAPGNADVAWLQARATSPR